MPRTVCNCGWELVPRVASSDYVAEVTIRGVLEPSARLPVTVGGLGFVPQCWIHGPGQLITVLVRLRGHLIPATRRRTSSRALRQHRLHRGTGCLWTRLPRPA